MYVMCYNTKHKVYDYRFHREGNSQRSKSAVLKYYTDGSEDNTPKTLTV